MIAKKGHHLTSATRAICITLLLLCHCHASWGETQSLPFFKNFPASVYKAHNRNFDIVCDDYGSVFVANFEGLLYFDGASWRKIHTPGISRITCLAKDSKRRIWFGGYNVFGYLKPDTQGQLKMHTIVSDDLKGGFGEVDHIKETKGTIYIHTTNGKCYSLTADEKVQPMPDTQKVFAAPSDSDAVLQLKWDNFVTFSHYKGLSFYNMTPSGARTWCTLSEEEGLISNTVNKLAFNNGNFVWGATDKGLFCVEAMSPYTMLNEHTGLKGEVNCITECGDLLYCGTMEGLFCLDKNGLNRIGGLDLACWQFAITDNGMLYAATSTGLYRINGHAVTHIADGNTLSVSIDMDGNGCYTGEFDGIYHNAKDGKQKMISKIEKVTHISLEGSDIMAETINGELWKISTTSQREECLRLKPDVNMPKAKFVDKFGTTWATDNNGRNLEIQSKDSYTKVLKPWINPFRSKTLNAIFVSKDGDVWLGGDFGMYHLAGKDLKRYSRGKAQPPFIREIVIMGDSVIWGGYDSNMIPKNSVDGINLPSSCNHITITFSTRNMSVIKPTLYRHRTDGGRWSAWTEDTDVEFNNPFYGSTTVEIQSLDLFGRLSNPASVTWYRQFPIYMRWWAILIYLIILIYGITTFLKWRTKRLQKDKEKLEGIVAERTSELSAAYNEQQKISGQLKEAYDEQQKISGQLKEAYDEQQKISAELSDTLDDLKRTQDDLVRMERTATAGKLTQGLIDRILNPINYINNFSKLTSGLAKDLQEDIEDEKDNMSEDNYEDCEDILDMMTQNLQKIEEHGVNTTRTLRAMEAMLNYQVGILVNQDILPLCHQAMAVAAEHFKADVARYGITMRTELPESPVMISYDAEAMNKVLLSLITNSVYAVVKKYSQMAYSNPEVCLKVVVDNHNVAISIRDNGIGIEDTIKDKVFDPFFTTKPTGEAAGVGLYLAREIISDHKGTITLDSEKGEYCEFTISIKK